MIKNSMVYKMMCNEKTNDEVWQYKPSQFSNWVDAPNERYSEYKSFEEYKKEFLDLQTRKIIKTKK